MSSLAPAPASGQRSPSGLLPFLTRLRRESTRGLVGGFYTERSDLDAEELEELIMLTGLPAMEIHRLRKEFLKHASSKTHITLEEFLSIPVVSINPLRMQLAGCFGFVPTAKPSISFQVFATQIAAFNGPGRLDQKLRLAFRLQDFDRDGKLSKDDLMRYLEAVSMASGEGSAIDYEGVAENILKEGSTDEEQRFICFEAFQRIVGPTEFEPKLRIMI